MFAEETGEVTNANFTEWEREGRFGYLNQGKKSLNSKTTDFSVILSRQKVRPPRFYFAKM